MPSEIPTPIPILAPDESLPFPDAVVVVGDGVLDVTDGRFLALLIEDIDAVGEGVANSTPLI